MGSTALLLPEGYRPVLGILDTEIAIKLVKDSFERNLANNLHLTRVSAPLFVEEGTGLNDNLNGVERPVAFDVPDCSADVQIVHSLAKWKRMALARYGFAPGTGLYTDMNAIRRDENLDNLHSIYVDQWDWEKMITRENRTRAMLEHTVRRIMAALIESERDLCVAFPQLVPFLCPEVTFITSQELEDRYPTLSPKEREDAICKEYGTVFLEQIGAPLRSGKPHDGRAPDYDDWALNGDLLIWYPVLSRSLELSSMGIRVDERSLDAQLTAAHCDDRRTLPFHKALLEGKLPITMGGGIGQSRICMALLQKAHIGEVQSSIWPKEMIAICEEHGIPLL